jgi:DNA-binding response OmpR family regulator
MRHATRKVVSVPAAPIVVATANSWVRKLLAYVLLEAGYEVVTVPDEAAARHFVVHRQAALLITDHSFEQDDSWTRVRYVRRNGLPTRILVVRDGRSDRAPLATWDVDGYLSRPFDLEVFLLTVERLVFGSARRTGDLQGASVGGSALPTDPSGDAVPCTPSMTVGGSCEASPRGHQQWRRGGETAAAVGATSRRTASTVPPILPVERH